jgi:hypothetical protein
MTLRDVVEMPREELVKMLLTPPSDYAYYGDLDRDVWGWSPLANAPSMATCIERANWRVIEEIVNETEGLVIEGAKHWAFGHLAWSLAQEAGVYQVMVDTSNEDAMRVLVNLMQRIAESPCLSDEYYAEEKAEEESLSG